MTSCQARNSSYGNLCGNLAVFAVWYEGAGTSATGTCGKHLAKTCRDMLVNATQASGQFVKVTSMGTG